MSKRAAIKRIVRAVLAFARLGRPQFLVGGVVLHGLGVTLALYDGARLNGAALVWGQIAITATQWMTHYSNDYFDLEADRANTTPSRWSGGSRVLPEGALSPQIARASAYCLMAIAITALLVIAAVIRPGGFTVGLFGLALGGAWFYSAPPLRLHSRGLGELTSAGLVAGLTPLVGFYLQTGRLALLPALAVLPLIGFQFTMLLAVEFPDRVGDALVGKRTLVVQLGMRRAARLYQVTLLAAYLVLPGLVMLGLPPLVAFVVGGSTPLAIIQGWRLERYVNQSVSADWSSFAFWNIVLLLGTAAGEAVAVLMLVGWV